MPNLTQPPTREDDGLLERPAAGESDSNAAVPATDVHRKKLIQAIDGLPPLPAILNQLLRVLNDQSCSAGQIASLIEKDSVLSGSVLRCVNSAYYGLRHRVSSIRHAVSLLGFSTVRNLALAFSMRRMLVNPRGLSQDRYRAYSQHALGAAIMTQFLALYTRHNEVEGAFAAGLFHDVGQLLMLSYQPKQSIPFYEERIGAPNLADAEDERFGISHPELSALVLEKWKLPAELCDAVRFHEAPEAQLSDSVEQPTLAQLVNAADIYVQSYGLSTFEIPEDEIADPAPSFARIGLADKLPELMERFKSEFQSIRDAFE